MSAIGGRPTPAPPRTPLIAWWVFPLCLLVFVATTTVPFGGAMSGLLSGHGFAWPAGPFGLGGYKALVMSPGDPAARWPSQPVPGGPVLTWICMAIGLIISGACANRRIDRPEPGPPQESEDIRLGRRPGAAALANE